MDAAKSPKTAHAYPLLWSSTVPLAQSIFPAVTRQAKSLIAEADLILDLPDSRNACFP
jgi:hypothetical protein